MQPNEIPRLGIQWGVFDDGDDEGLADSLTD